MKEGRLTICPTPIGNLKDMTQRALDALRDADVVCAEDTRVTGKLLAAAGIKKRLERLDEAMLSKVADQIMERIKAGEKIVYCSDAGMPGVSDPGLRLVRAAQEAGVNVEVLPGPSAGLTAYVASGFTCPRYYFGGFFPRKDGERTETLEQLRTLDAVLVFYESPNRLVSALQKIAKAFPHREVAVCRELSKLHEEVYRASSTEVAEEYTTRMETSGIKGEIVMVIDAPTAEERVEGSIFSEEQARKRASDLKAEDGYSNKDIIAILQSEFGISRNSAYRIVVG